jgi:hypothetical protein
VSARTLAAWVAARTPEAPGELRAHMARDLGAAADGSADAVAEALLQACEGALDRVLRSADAERETALDLLSADAYVTYAFEAAADDPSRIAALAEQAMRRIADRAAPHLPPIERP